MTESISIRKAGLVAIAMLVSLSLPMGRLAFAPQGDPPALLETIRKVVGDADYCLTKGQFQNALTKAEEVLKISDDNVEALQIKAEVCAIWHVEHNKEALEASKSALAAQEAQIPEIVVFMEQIDNGQADKTIEAINEIIRKEPGSSRRSLYHYILSRAYSKKGKNDLVVRELREAIGWRNNFEQAYHDLINIYTQLANQDLATRLSDYLLGYDPMNLEWRLLKASVWAGTNRTTQAKAAAEQVATMLEEGEDGDGRNLGLAYYVLATASFREYQRLPERGDLEKRLKDAYGEFDKFRDKEKGAYERQVALQDCLTKTLPFIVDRAMVRGAREELLAAKRENDDAEKAVILEKAVPLVEKLFEDILAQKEDLLEQVKENAEKAAEADKLLGEPYALMAGYYTGEGMLKEAAEQYEKYLSVREEAPNHCYLLGLIRLLLGEKDKAKQIFAAIKDEKNEKQELAYIGEALLAGLEGNTDTAKREYDALLALREKEKRGDWAMLETMLAHTLYAQNKPGEAGPHLEKGVSAMGGLVLNEGSDYAELLGTTDPKALGHLNFVLALSGARLTEQALVQCNKFLENVPDSTAGHLLQFMLMTQGREHHKEAEGMIQGLKEAFDKKDKKNVTPCMAAAVLYNNLAAEEQDRSKRDDLATLALEEYKEAIEKDPEFGIAYAILARAHERRGEVHKAREIAQKGLEKDVGNMTLLNTLIELMAAEGEADIDDYIKLYEDFIDKVDISPREDIDRQAGVMALGNYYRQLGRVKQARIQYANLLDSIEEEKEPEKKRRQYLEVFRNMRELSLAESKVEEARKYNAEIKKIDEDFPGTDHFEGLCYLVEGKDDKAKAAFEREVALGRMSMTNAMSSAGLALIELRGAGKERRHDVHRRIEEALNLTDKIKEREALFGSDLSGINAASGYLDFIKVCTFLAQGGGLNITKASKILNRTAELFPGAEGLGASETTAFKGIFLRQVLKEWKSDNNFHDLALGAYYLGQGLYAEASKRMEAELAVNKDNFIALLFQARAEDALDNEAAAMKLLKKCQQMQDGKFIPAYSTMLSIYLRRSNKPHEEILELLEVMCNLDSLFRYNKATYIQQFYPEEALGKDKNKMALEEYDKLCGEEDLPNRWQALNAAAWLRAEHFDKDNKEIDLAERQMLVAIELLEKTKPPGRLERTIPGINYLLLMATIKDTYGWVLYKQGVLADVDVKREKFKDASKIFDECIAALNINVTHRSMPVVLYHQGVVFNALRETAKNATEAADYKNKAIDALDMAVAFQRFDNMADAKALLDKLKGPPE